MIEKQIGSLSSKGIKDLVRVISAHDTARTEITREECVKQVVYVMWTMRMTGACDAMHHLPRICALLCDPSIITSSDKTLHVYITDVRAALDYLRDQLLLPLDESDPVAKVMTSIPNYDRFRSSARRAWLAFQQAAAQHRFEIDDLDSLLILLAYDTLNSAIKYWLSKHNQGESVALQWGLQQIAPLTTMEGGRL